MTESALLANVVEACRWLGLRCYHTHDSRRSVAGFPDLVIVGEQTDYERVCVLFRELKVNSRVSLVQQGWIAALVRAGADVAVWRENDWPDLIMAELRAIAAVRK